MKNYFNFLNNIQVFKRLSVNKQKKGRKKGMREKRKGLNTSFYPIKYLKQPAEIERLPNFWKVDNINIFRKRKCFYLIITIDYIREIK